MLLKLELSPGSNVPTGFFDPYKRFLPCSLWSVNSNIPCHQKAFVLVSFLPDDKTIWLVPPCSPCTPPTCSRFYQRTGDSGSLLGWTWKPHNHRPVKQVEQLEYAFADSFEIWIWLGENTKPWLWLVRGRCTSVMSQWSTSSAKREMKANTVIEKALQLWERNMKKTGKR